MGKVRALADKAASTVKDVKTYWNHPKPGEHIPNKELFYFMLGAGGCGGAGAAEANLAFTANCFFVGAIYGLAIKDFVLLGIVSMVMNYLFEPINMLVTDNLGFLPKKTMRNVHVLNLAFVVVGVASFFVPQAYFESLMPAFPQVIGTKLLIQVANCYFRIFLFRKFAAKYGKYRPWIFVNFVPFIITSLMLVLFPYKGLEYHQRFWIMHMMFSLWNLFSNYNDQVGNIENVITPNTAERTKVMSIGPLVYNLIPSIVGIFLPMLIYTAGGQTDIRAYRGPILVCMLAFAPLSLFLAFRVKERVIIGFDRRPDINLKRGILAVVKNKYIWLYTLSTQLFELRGSLVNIVQIIGIYMLRKDWILGVFAAIIGTANIPGYLLANYFIKKLGKKRVILISNYVSIGAAFLQIGAIALNNIVLIMIIQYIANVIVQLGDIAKRGAIADIWDYQQYISGERTESFLGAIRMFTAPIFTIAALLVPAVYGSFGFTSDWTVLYDSGIRNSIFTFTVIISTVFGLLSLLPWHFYDLSEDKHRQIISELEEREEERLAALAVESEGGTDA